MNEQPDPIPSKPSKENFFNVPTLLASILALLLLDILVTLLHLSSLQILVGWIIIISVHLVYHRLYYDQFRNFIVALLKTIKTNNYNTNNTTNTMSSITIIANNDDNDDDDNDVRQQQQQQQQQRQSKKKQNSLQVHQLSPTSVINIATVTSISTSTATATATDTAAVGDDNCCDGNDPFIPFLPLSLYDNSESCTDDDYGSFTAESTTTIIDHSSIRNERCNSSTRTDNSGDDNDDEIIIIEAEKEETTPRSTTRSRSIMRRILIQELRAEIAEKKVDHSKQLAPLESEIETLLREENNTPLVVVSSTSTSTTDIDTTIRSTTNNVLVVGAPKKTTTCTDNTNNSNDTDTDTDPNNYNNKSIVESNNEIDDYIIDSKSESEREIEIESNIASNDDQESTATSKAKEMWNNTLKEDTSISVSTVNCINCNLKSNSSSKVDDSIDTDINRNNIYDEESSTMTSKERNTKTKKTTTSSTFPSPTTTMPTTTTQQDDHYNNDDTASNNDSSRMMNTLTHDLGKSQSTGIAFALELLELSHKNTKLHDEIQELRQTNALLAHQLQKLQQQQGRDATVVSRTCSIPTTTTNDYNTSVGHQSPTRRTTTHGSKFSPQQQRLKKMIRGINNCQSNIRRSSIN